MAEEAPDAAATTLTKYPRTPHLPFSPGRTDDDEELASYTGLIGSGIEVVITEKLDGGNCCIKDGAVFARTHKHPASHESFDPVKVLHKVVLANMLSADVLARFELFGENMTAVHSIDYTPEVTGDGERRQLASPFYLFAVFDRKRQLWLSWDHVTALSQKVGDLLPTPPVLFRGVLKDEAQLKALILGGMSDGTHVTTANDGLSIPAEGFVVRRTAGFSNAEFGVSVAKYVRPNHIQTDETFNWSWKRSNFAL